MGDVITRAWAQDIGILMMDTNHYVVDDTMSHDDFDSLIDVIEEMENYLYESV